MHLATVAVLVARAPTSLRCWSCGYSLPIETIFIQISSRIINPYFINPLFKYRRKCLCSFFMCPCSISCKAFFSINERYFCRFSFFFLYDLLILFHICLLRKLVFDCNTFTVLGKVMLEPTQCLGKINIISKCL